MELAGGNPAALYRVAAESHIVNALISAARNGKNVIVFVVHRQYQHPR